MKKATKKRFLKKRYLFLSAALVIVILGIISAYFFVIKDIPSAAGISQQNYPQSTKIFDRNGNLLYTIYANRNQTFVPILKIPKSLQEATIAIEDRDFYKHGAVDFRGMARAFVSTVFHKQIQGGSTLTQQLVKNSLLTPEQTIQRKVKEIVLSFVVESIYTKKQILEMYLNQVPYGGTSWGVESASETYFNKPANKLDLAQSAFLAGLPENPSVLSPFGTHPELAKQRQELVLSDMQQQGYITIQQERKAAQEKLTFAKFANSIQAPHFVLYVKDLLEQKYGQRLVEQGGLKVITSLDLSIQNFAQQTVATQVAQLQRENVTNGAALVTDPKTGEILAMVGSKNYFDTADDGNVNVTLAHRQPGSSIKPINYVTGLIKGYTAATPFIDEKTCFPNPVGAAYCPVNYDSKFHGVVQMREALGNSFNIPAVKMLKVNGLDAMIATASAMGITTFTDPQRYGLSLTLGGGEVTMLQMAEAFGVFANLGYRVDLHPILKVTDSKGNVLEQYSPPNSPLFGTKVIPESAAWIISNILADNNARLIEFGSNSPLHINNYTVSVKTGTTNDFRDNWTIGYTPSYVVAVWVGNNNDTPMSGIVSGITGAAPIWHTIMSKLISGKPDEKLAKPSTVVGATVCSTSGLLPPPDGTPNRCPTRFEYFMKGTVPAKVDPGTQKVWIDKDTNDLPPPGKTDNLDLRDEVVVTDPTNAQYCLTCPHPTPSPTPTP